MKDPEYREGKKEFGIGQSGSLHQYKDKISDLEDLQLWKMFKNGKEEALIYIYRAYVNVLYNYGCQFTREKEIVKDTVQEFFIELIRNKHNLSDTDSIKYYLLKSFRRKLARVLKKENKYTKEEISENEQGFKIAQNPELRYIKNQLDEKQKAVLKAKFNHLPDKQREAILLYYYEGLSYKEIASLFQMSRVKSARVLIYRAIDNLSKELKDYREMLLMLTLFFV